MVTISIVTVCFNSVKTIEQTIRSVINQSYKNIEYIIIDGGSTDGTLDIIRQYEPYISYWVSEPDKGIYDAMNKGIKVATGELIAFINSDDWYDKDAMLHFADEYKKKVSDVLFGDMIYINGDGTEQYESNRNIDLERMLYTNKLCHQGICVNTDLMKNNFFDLHYKIAADYDFLLKVFIQGGTFSYIGDYVVAYFRREGVSTTNVIEAIEEMSEIANKRSVCFLDSNNYEEKLSNVKKLLQLRKFYGIQQKIYSDIIHDKCQLFDISHIISNTYIIFGSGMVGKQVLNILQHIGADIECFIDSNSALWGLDYNGKAIIDPHSVSPGGAKIIISSYEHSEDMAKVLDDAGFVENKDYFKYDTWVSWLKKHIRYINVDGT